MKEYKVTIEQRDILCNALDLRMLTGELGQLTDNQKQTLDKLINNIVNAVQRDINHTNGRLDHQQLDYLRKFDANSDSNLKAILED
ncbi:hypothetical protein PO185_09505 [Limosilactobacillus mucosae]|uniref:hypothetical protein n=1 Tax=Limosilactobacillus mucosae TaxID=97478 RepID=UPI00233EDEA5|nr:hypothetical protein [Limosilactobacillus mucosae]MDC2845880.1 hypothetical protein [Limosilactobacillus mucosae]